MERGSLPTEDVPPLNRPGTPAPQPTPSSVSPPPRRFRCPPAEWVFALAFAAFGIWIYFRTPISWVAAGVVLYRHLALAFTAASHIMMMLAYSLTLLRHVPDAERGTWTRNAAFLAAAVTLACALLVPAPEASQLGRLLESSMLGFTLTALTLTLFLPVAGLVSLRRVAGTLAETLLLWGPYLIYFAFCGYCLAASRLATLQVKDPVLMRMDLSLGFSASQVAYAWHYEAPWIRDVSSNAYRLLGLLIALVIARLQIARAWAHARRALFASFLVGVLGIGCYHLVPAVGPIYAYPALHRQLDTPARQAEAAAVRASVLDGTGEVTAPRRLYRNAMPSLHTAFSLVALAAAWNWRRRFFWACLPLGILQIVTTLTLAYHYLVDLLAAVPFAVFCWWVADVLIRATPGRKEEPLPPSALPFSSRLLRIGLALPFSLAVLLFWAQTAPLSPWAAWPLAFLTVAPPVWALSPLPPLRPRR